MPSDHLRCDASSPPSKGPALEKPLAETAQRAIAQGLLDGSSPRGMGRGLWLHAFRLHWDPQAERSDRLRAWQLLLAYEATAEWAREHWPADL